MNRELASALVDVVRLGSDPLVIRFRKLEDFANSVGIRIRVDGDAFTIYRHGKDLHSCGTTAGLNDWFKQHYQTEVL